MYEVKFAFGSPAITERDKQPVSLQRAETTETSRKSH